VLGIAPFDTLRIGPGVLVEALRGLAPLSVEEREIRHEELRLVTPTGAGMVLREASEAVRGVVVVVGPRERACRMERVLEHMRATRGGALVEHPRGLERAATRLVENVSSETKLDQVRHLGRRCACDLVERPQGVVGAPGVGEGLGADEQLLAQEWVRRREPLERLVGFLPPGRIGGVDADPTRVPRREGHPLRPHREPKLACARLGFLQAGLVRKADDALADATRVHDLVRFLVCARRGEKRGWGRVRAEIFSGLFVGADDEPRLGQVASDIVRQQRHAHVEPIEALGGRPGIVQRERHARAHVSDFGQLLLGCRQLVELGGGRLPPLPSNVFHPRQRVRLCGMERGVLSGSGCEGGGVHRDRRRREGVGSRRDRDRRDGSFVAARAAGRYRDRGEEPGVRPPHEYTEKPPPPR